MLVILNACITLSQTCIAPPQAASIVAESSGGVIEAGGELITSQYFDSLAAEVDDLLQVRLHNAIIQCDYVKNGVSGTAGSSYCKPTALHLESTLPRCVLRALFCAELCASYWLRMYCMVLCMVLFWH